MVAFARLRGPRRPGQEVAARGTPTAATQWEEEAAGARGGVGGRKRMVPWPSRGHRTGRSSRPGDGDSWEGQTGMTAGLQPPGHPGSLPALSHTVILHCPVLTQLLLPGKRNREGCTAQPGATEVPLSPCGSGAPWSQQENLGLRQLQRRRGRWLIRTQDLGLCHHPMSRTPQTWRGDKRPHLPAPSAPSSSSVSGGGVSLPLPHCPQPQGHPADTWIWSPAPAPVLPVHPGPGESPVAPSGSRLLQNKGRKEG